jgi:hypothetical protein
MSIFQVACPVCGSPATKLVYELGGGSLNCSNPNCINYHPPDFRTRA